VLFCAVLWNRDLVTANFDAYRVCVRVDNATDE